MGLSGADYRQQMQALLPQGAAWPRDEDAQLTQLLRALAEEYARVDGRAIQLVEEADPRTAAELLTDWERVAGLPDNCSGLLAETQQGRRHDLVSKLVSQGGQSRAYFVELARAMGFTVKISEYRPFRVGVAHAGDQLSNGDWRHTWSVRAPINTTVKFRVGVSAVGEPLALWGNASMECRIRHYRPAHTNLFFSYGPSTNPLLLMPDGTPLLMPAGIGFKMEYR